MKHETLQSLQKTFIYNIVILNKCLLKTDECPPNVSKNNLCIRYVIFLKLLWTDYG